MNLLSIFKKKEENKRSLVCVDWSGTGQLRSGVEKPLICVNVPNSFYTLSKIRKLLFGQLIKETRELKNKSNVVAAKQDQFTVELEYL